MQPVCQVLVAEACREWEPETIYSGIWDLWAEKDIMSQCLGARGRALPGVAVPFLIPAASHPSRLPKGNKQMEQFSIKMQIGCKNVSKNLNTL